MTWIMDTRIPGKHIKTRLFSVWIEYKSWPDHLIIGQLQWYEHCSVWVFLHNMQYLLWDIWDQFRYSVWTKICNNVKYTDLFHLCYIYLTCYPSPANLFSESLYFSISITVQACAKDLYKNCSVWYSDHYCTEGILVFRWITMINCAWN